MTMNQTVDSHQDSSSPELILQSVNPSGVLVGLPNSHGTECILWATHLQPGLGEVNKNSESPSSGKLLVRWPNSWHRALTKEAEADGVSLNSWIVAKVAAQLRDVVRA